MKKIRMVFIFFVAFLLLSITNIVFATEEETKLLYQDITINQDGSITVKEAAWLNGEYNGRLRDIEFNSYSATPFTGIYSNFAGNTDIYNGTSMKDIKVYDISQENFNSIDDIGKVETIYKEVNRASNGRYGVYELEENRIWC